MSFSKHDLSATLFSFMFIITPHFLCVLCEADGDCTNTAAVTSLGSGSGRVGDADSCRRSWTNARLSSHRPPPPQFTADMFSGEYCDRGSCVNH